MKLGQNATVDIVLRLHEFSMVQEIDVTMISSIYHLGHAYSISSWMVVQAWNYAAFGLLPELVKVIQFVEVTGVIYLHLLSFGPITISPHNPQLTLSHNAIMKVPTHERVEVLELMHVQCLRHFIEADQHTFRLVMS